MTTEESTRPQLEPPMSTEERAIYLTRAVMKLEDARAALVESSLSWEKLGVSSVSAVLRRRIAELTRTLDAFEKPQLNVTGYLFGRQSKETIDINLLELLKSS